MSEKFSRKRKLGPILLYACSETDADIYYATDFFAPDPFIFFRTAGGRRYLVMSDLEIDRAKTTSSAHRVLSLEQYAKRAETRFGKRPGVAEVIAEVLKDFRIRKVTVPENFPVGTADRLREQKIKVAVKCDPFFPERLTKSAAEVDEIKKTMRAAEAGMRAAVDAIGKSKIKNGFLEYRGRKLTAEILKMIINTTILSLGYLPSHTIVAPGKQGCDPHNEGSGPVRASEPIIIDIFPRSQRSGYFGDITRTVVRGRVPEKVLKMYRTVLEGQRLGLKMIRDGTETRVIHQAILDYFEKRGYPTGRVGGRMQGFFHGTGHGLGLDLHEAPRIAINDLKLKKGMIVTVEPGLYYTSIGGIRIEDTVLVTKKGIENLTRFPKRLEISRR